MVAPYPTLGEVSKRAAGAYFSPKLFDNPVVEAGGVVCAEGSALGPAPRPVGFPSPGPAGGYLGREEGRGGGRGGQGGRFFRTLSGRFLLLTVAFVMLAEVLIFLPSIARYRYDLLSERLKMAQIAALTQLAAEDVISPELEAELLANAEVFNVVLRRDEVRQLVLSSPVPGEIAAQL